MLSPRGSITSHPATDQIFVSDIASVVEAIREVIRNIDIPPKQVMIEARIVEASTGFSNSLGVRLKYFASGVASPGGGIKGSLGTSAGNLSNVDAFGTPATPSLVRTSTQGFGTTFSTTGTTAINLMLFNSAATRLLSMELLAAEADDKNKTVSAPRVVTQNRKLARIKNTEELSLLDSINAQTGTPNYKKIEAPLTLEVTPTITPDNKINMQLKIEKGTITNLLTGSRNTNELETNVIVENGGTVVIGGFARDNDTSSEERVPFLGDLPYVGFLFKAKTRNVSRSELLVFITPRIVTDTVAQR
jgi:type IV pilus assembly protein PilQ